MREAIEIFQTQSISHQSNKFRKTIRLVNFLILILFNIVCKYQLLSISMIVMDSVLRFLCDRWISVNHVQDC